MKSHSFLILTSAIALSDEPDGGRWVRAPSRWRKRGIAEQSVRFLEALTESLNAILRDS
jgi:hypothetical protein